jgi:hypothetical protein
MSNIELQQIKELVEHLTPQERADLAAWFDSKIKPSLPNQR